MISEVVFMVWSILDVVVEDGHSSLLIEYFGIRALAIRRVEACPEQRKILRENVLHDLSSSPCMPKSE